MLAAVPMKLKHPGDMWLTFRRICERDPVKEINLLRTECEQLDITDDILIIINSTPFPDDVPNAITISLNFEKNHRVVSRFLPHNAQAPLEVLFVAKKWLATQSQHHTLHLLIIPASIAQDEETTPAEAIRRFLRHYVVEKPDAILFTTDLWTLWSSFHPGSAPEDKNIAGIKRVSVWRYLKPIVPDLPSSTVVRAGPNDTARCWAGYTLREEPPLPSCPVVCSCSATLRY